VEAAKEVNAEVYSRHARLHGRRHHSRGRGGRGV
jgi:hypothetical protein